MDQSKLLAKQTKQTPQENSVTFLPLGGIEDVTKNMYLYQYKDEILIVDCGIGFADETMLGVDLLLPDIKYLLETKKKIVGMVLSHGHEDHIGALPFILPQLPNFPIYASPFTAALANEKLGEFKITTRVKPVQFTSSQVRLGSFTCELIRITHSVPDTANILIKTPVGNFYHGSDFKFDLTPYDRKRTDFQKIAKAGWEGVLCLMADSLGSERAGFTPSELPLRQHIEDAMRETKGKFILTTYSSNIARLNQTIEVAEQLHRKVCFVGRSLIKAKSVAQQLGYLRMNKATEVTIDQIKRYKDSQLVLLVAGSQGQENSSMTRIAEGDHREISLSPHDVVVFSSDTIPGNEISVNELVDTIAKSGATVLYSGISRNFHVSGHGSEGDEMLMISLTTPKFLVPISGTYRQMIAYKALSEKLGYKDNQISLIQNGREVIFTKSGMRLGRKIDVRNIYVDQVSGEEVESFVLRDRELLAKEGIIILLVEIDSTNGQLATKPEVVARGFSASDSELLSNSLMKALDTRLKANKGKVGNWVYVRKLIEDVANQHIFRALHRRPLVMPVVIEV